METYGWTERELYEEVSAATIERALVLEVEREKARKVKEIMDKQKAGKAR